jgi:hypothetical protein
LPLLAEDEPDAKELGYVADASLLEARLNEKFAHGQQCVSCDLYRGNFTAESGPCKTFPGRRVLSHGWCTQYEGYGA